MQLQSESSDIHDYLTELEDVNYLDPLIQEKVKELFHQEMTEIEKVKKAYEYVRDEIAHSWDIQSKRVTRTASEVLAYQEGICYAKSNLLAALLRAITIPTGFCYQRLMLFDTPEKGYCLHALNAVYLSQLGRWVRLDARGNKPGVKAEFSLEQERLAFPVNQQSGEIDYPIIFKEPNKQTIETLKANTNQLELYVSGLPNRL